MSYVSAELVVRTFLAAQFPTTRVVTETPADLQDQVPLLRVVRFGGSDDELTLDVARVDVDAFAIGRDAARQLGEDARTALRLKAPGQTVAGGFIAAVRTESAPSWTPWDDTDLRRFTSTYAVSIRSVP